ncbi:uncharacterized protein B0I36DRAFT_356281 [Microdochium trichocladiopsis]|uniref:Uncharacterized protein n=1 Tax=Microdochium trichocladiopsis TaxID=1682393 RepID=A0A9P8XSK2_9PEZI|nr:uncharacterized protein B0I36DRAFT_404266 [Microdochium trichocladiopsis]XP_046004576.1 uncharacterized protein B0I36DRAFT_356281 [Microdochium trichocladiopsis]KAH7009115.1 hypothetical protein B0I36DRAFT_404266 [Microdochium trichocladiopsis]KAH7012200.1 hypothetical protein B0I36DRAFT_356281 [Microdochium trichocladiopsis]
MEESTTVTATSIEVQCPTCKNFSSTGPYAIFHRQLLIDKIGSDRFLYEMQGQVSRANQGMESEPELGPELQSEIKPLERVGSAGPRLQRSDKPSPQTPTTEHETQGPCTERYTDDGRSVASNSKRADSRGRSSHRDRFSWRARGRYGGSYGSAERKRGIEQPYYPEYDWPYQRRDRSGCSNRTRDYDPDAPSDQDQRRYNRRLVNYGN